MRNGKKQKEEQKRERELQGDESTKAGCHGPAAAVRSTKRVESSLDFASPEGIGACETCSIENISIAVMAVTSAATWREFVTPKRNE